MKKGTSKNTAVKKISAKNNAAVRNAINPRATHGGARANSGPRPVDGATGLKRYTVMLDSASVDALRVIGDGNLSVGIRIAAKG